LQLPLNNVGVIALDYQGNSGIATSIGHAPVAGLIDPATVQFFPLQKHLQISFGHPWPKEFAVYRSVPTGCGLQKIRVKMHALYYAVEAASDFACALGINIPTGKDSMSMTQKYR
jgi:phosphoribosylformylglycinamidine synthase